MRQILPLLPSRGFATPSGIRHPTLAEVLAHALAEDVTLRMDGTEGKVRRSKANRLGRRTLVSGKKSPDRS